jgi:hypothetical protein
MGVAPIGAIKTVLDRANMKIGDVDVVELNEAFAAQVIPIMAECDIPLEKMNTHGGAIALGHPFGMTGARIMGTLLNAMETDDHQVGIETMCVAGGQGEAMIVERLKLTAKSFVVELASNDGYLLQHFVAKGIPVLGIEPAANVAEVARKKNVPTLVKFFGRQTASELVAERGRANLVLGNNVLAQVPDINDFVAGIKVLLAPHGVVTIEFPHLMKLMEENQFDTIYHEHFFYFSLMSAERIVAAHGMTLFDVEELPTHGGSLRIYGHHTEDKTHSMTERYRELVQREKAAGVERLDTYATFAEHVKETKRKLLEFLIEAKRKGKTIVGYGAPGKGNTLLNYCGVRGDFIDSTVDRNTYKQGKFLPGTHIPIFPPEKIRETKPDYVLILPWNFKDEIMDQVGYIREWGGQFVVPIPEVRVYS